MAGIVGGKNWFFDSDAVLKVTTAAERKVLSKQGAFVRRRARASIRKRAKPSQPGQPPRSVKGFLRQFLYFVFDPQTRSVVVGPAAFKSRPRTPSLLEFGGTSTRQEVRLRHQWVTARLQGRLPKKLKSRRVPVAYGARPYMGPALDAERPKFADMWKDAVRA